MIEAVLGSLTKHAAERMLERRVSGEDISAAMQCGQMFHRGGAVIYFMGRRAAREYTEDARSQDRLTGLTVVCDSRTQAIITSYRNDKACRKIRKQVDYRTRVPNGSEPRAWDVSMLWV